MQEVSSVNPKSGHDLAISRRSGRRKSDERCNNKDDVEHMWSRESRTIKNLQERSELRGSSFRDP